MWTNMCFCLIEGINRFYPTSSVVITHNQSYTHGIDHLYDFNAGKTVQESSFWFRHFEDGYPHDLVPFNHGFTLPQLPFTAYFVKKMSAVDRDESGGPEVNPRFKRPLPTSCAAPSFSKRAHTAAPPRRDQSFLPYSYGSGYVSVYYRPPLVLYHYSR